MEEVIFHRPEVSEALAKTVEARLHTDGPMSEPWQELQKKRTGTLATPVYVLMDPATERTLGIFEGATQNASEFATWIDGIAGHD